MGGRLWLPHYSDNHPIHPSHSAIPPSTYRFECSKAFYREVWHQLVISSSSARHQRKREKEKDKKTKRQKDKKTKTKRQKDKKTKRQKDKKTKRQKDEEDEEDEEDE